MRLNVCFRGSEWARTISILAALSFSACADANTPIDDDEDAPTEEEVEAASAKDASVKRDASKETAVSKDAGGKEPTDTDKPKDAGAKPAPADAGAAKDAGATKPDAGGSAPAGDAGPSVSGIAPAELEMLRQVCIDEINRYRATLMIAPIARPTPEQELCSDRGAKMDGDSKKAHGSAGARNPCATEGGMRGFPGFQSQNTCPGYPVGGFGAATIADALKGCLKQMWAEGEPPEGEAKCLSDYFAGNTKCFLAHGHYINMKSATAKKIACGFYNMGSNTYWMNQDFI